MKTNVGYKINTGLKKEYDKFILEEYGHKKNRCGLELSKWIKLGLTLHGHSDYVDDPDVQEMLRLSVEKYHSTHTQNFKDSDKDTYESNEDRIQRLEEELAQMKVQLVKAVSQDPRKERDHYHQMDSFVSTFQEEYGDHHQVSMNEISNLVMKKHGVCDRRSIHNRVEYLVARGCIEPYAPNVYNIK